MSNRGEQYFSYKTPMLLENINGKVHLIDINKLPSLLTLSTSGKITGKGNKSLCAWSTTPIISCPGSTEACREGCYGCTGNFRFPAVKTSQYRNLMVFSRMLNEGKQVQLVDGLVALVQSSPAFFAGQFRLFEVGDFYNQEVVNTWVKVVQRLPKTLFWAYTRSFHLDFSELIGQQNMSLFGSADHINKDKCEAWTKKNDLRVAYALPKGCSEPVEGSILCPHQTDKVHSCWDCGLCFKGKLKTNISFLYH